MFHAISDAAKVAIQLMLQEEFDHPITSYLALYSCYSYLNNPQPDPWDPQPKPKPIGHTTSYILNELWRMIVCACSM